MTKLEMKIPPVVVTLLTALLMWGSSLLLSQSHWSFTLRLLLFILLVIIGGSVALLGVWQFYKNKTTVNPIDPNNVNGIVCDGIYKYTRNPMYVGLALLLMGLVFLLGKLLLLFWVVFFVIYITKFQIKPEEQFLSNKFGKEFENYKKSVRRWV